jgi:hypothetical protein
MKSKPDLVDRVASALRKPESVTSADLERLLEEVNAEIPAAEKAVADAETAALDPRISEEEARKQEDAAREATFRLGRWRHRADALAELLETTREAEALAAKLSAYREAEALRDAAAQTVREKWPRLQAELLDLIETIAKADFAVESTRHERPEGFKMLKSTEAVAFGYDSPETIGIQYAPSSILEMVVPDAENYTRPAWAPHWSATSVHRPLHSTVLGYAREKLRAREAAE